MSSYRLLISEPPLQVLPTLAVHVGLNEAIVLQQIHYWITRDSAKVIEGKPWVYNTFQQWKVQFPFWSEKTIRRTLASLQDKNLIEAQNYNANKFDQTKWYTLNYEALVALEKSIKGMAADIGANASSQNDHIDLPKNEIELDKMTTSDMDKMTKSYKEQRITIDSQKGDAREEKVAAENLIGVWNQAVAPKDHPVALTPKRKNNLLAVFENEFGADISAWESYCLTIASTPFLMGETERSDWKVTLDWALDPDNVQKVREGAYGGVNFLKKEKTNEISEILLLKKQGKNKTEKEILYNIKSAIGSSNYILWFKDLNVVKYDKSSLLFEAPNKFIKEQVLERYQSVLIKKLKLKIDFI